MSKPSKKPPVKAPPSRLGKGLSALMSDSYSQISGNSGEHLRTSGDGVPVVLALDDIQPGKYQPRDYFNPQALEELAESIRKNGVVQPILVRRAGGGKFEIIAGERRWRAAAIAGQEKIPVIVRDLDDKKALEIALVENVQREDLNPLEEAAGYHRLMNEFRYTQEELAVAVQKSRSHIANLLRLLELPAEIRALLIENKLSMGHARALSGVADAGLIAQQVIEQNLSVRDTEKLARQGKGRFHERRPRKSSETNGEMGAAPMGHGMQAHMQLSPYSHTPVSDFDRQGPAHRDPDIMALEDTLSENLGLKVSINDRGQSGEIMIAYASLEQLDDILRRLGGSV